MRKLVVFISFFILLLQCAAQQYNTWYFGGAAGISFNTGGPAIPYALTDGINIASEGNASISDPNGKILFYTNGEKIYTRTHTVMLNGNNILGHESAVQSSLIIPAPGNDSIYYVFTTDAVENNFANGYRYSIVNIKHDGGKGEVVTKNVLLNTSCTERLTAARHANGIDVWIIGNERNSNIYKAWLVTCSGLQATPVISTVGTILNNEDLGMMKVSPDGRQLCQTIYADAAGNIFQLFDFDNATGMLFNPRAISNSDAIYFSCEFSPDSKLLYVTRASELFIDQFESKLGSAIAINASRVSIPATFGFYGIQTGPDEKIYLDRHMTKLSVISHPNTKGVGCTFEQDKIDLGVANGNLELPSAINDGPVDPYNNFGFTITDSCHGIVQFNGYTNMGGSLQWSWDFGDGTTSALQNPQHTYTNYKQLYSVKLTVKSITGCGYIERTKKIAPGGAFVKPDFDIIAKCDSNFVRFVNKSIIVPDDAPIQHIWDFGDGNTSTQRDPVHTYAGTASFTVKLKIKTGTSCVDDSLSKNLDLHQLTIQVPPAQTIDAGQSVQLYVTGGGSSFQWSPPQWLNDPVIQNPVATPQDNVTYRVTATNDAGCKVIDSVAIHVNPIDGIFVPTGFTPGNDGKNDLVRPIMGFQYTLREFSIYNRWGQKMFSTTIYGKGWDGKLNGQIQSPGVYVWIVTITDPLKKKIEKKGTVTLIR
jgi:gliding motility-associated-like protein